MSKRCSRCGETKDKSEFSRCSSHKDGLQYNCKACAAEYREANKEANRIYQLNYREANRKRLNAYQREKHTGVTLELYDELLESQKHRCAICGVHELETDRGLHADHCHDTGASRGLLCTKCNLGIGCFRDLPTLLSGAAEYLKNHHPSPYESEIAIHG